MSSFRSVPLRFAVTVTPLAQFAVTVPAIDEAVCAVMSHCTSEQLPSGRPAIVDEPHEPAKPDAAPVFDPPELVPPFEDPPVDVVPATPAFSEGAVGLKTFEDCWNEQLVARIAASNKFKTRTFFMDDALTLLYRHTQFWCVL
jgi:hypothetical protein